MEDSFFKNDANEQRKSEPPDLGDDPKVDTEDRFAGLGGDIGEGRMAAILSYIPFLCFVPLLSMQHNKDARFHARQGVLLFLIELVAALFLVDSISNFVFKAILIIAAALSVAGIYFAFQGKNYKLPFIGDLAEKSKL